MWGQIAAYELGLLLPEDQRPLPLDLIYINDSRSDIAPNAGAFLAFLCERRKILLLSVRHLLNAIMHVRPATMSFPYCIVSLRTVNAHAGSCLELDSSSDFLQAPNFCLDEMHLGMLIQAFCIEPESQHHSAELYPRL